MVAQILSFYALIRCISFSEQIKDGSKLELIHIADATAEKVLRANIQRGSACLEPVRPWKKIFINPDLRNKGFKF